jgi:hypothetical protein
MRRKAYSGSAVWTNEMDDKEEVARRSGKVIKPISKPACRSTCLVKFGHWAPCHCVTENEKTHKKEMRQRDGAKE